MANTPAFKIVLKGRDTGNLIPLAAFWPSGKMEDAYGGSFESEIKSITVNVGGQDITISDFSTVWVNMYDNRNSAPKPQAAASSGPF